MVVAELTFFGNSGVDGEVDISGEGAEELPPVEDLLESRVGDAEAIKDGNEFIGALSYEKKELSGDISSDVAEDHVCSIDSETHSRKVPLSVRSYDFRWRDDDVVC